MIFIVLLALTVVALAGAAEFFSVYGLAATFSGVFWSVVIMGAALGAGKLMGVSFLYRYWHKIGFALKAYLMAGIAALMMLTSLGIFGFLSAGYQQDVLPLKQKTEQIALLEDEKARALARKKQIDDLMAGGPAVTNLNKKDGTVDNNATRALRETTRSRESLVRQYRTEQADVTKRVAELDKELLVLKQEVIKTEAHIGPITYVAKAFNLPTDDATKYLILVIIFAFDPMAVALTLALNMAIRLREEEQAAAKAQEPAPFTPPQPMPPAPAPPPELTFFPDHPVVPTKDVVLDSRGSLDDVSFDTENQAVSKVGVEDSRGSLDDVSFDETSDTVAKAGVDDQRGSLDDFDYTLIDAAVEKQGVEEARGSLDDVTFEEEAPDSVLPDPVVEAEPHPEPEPPVAGITSLPKEPTDAETEHARRFRPYPGPAWNGDGSVLPDKMRELINHHKFLKAKQDNGDSLSRDEAWEFSAIEDILRKNGIDMYL
jgi:hypothetical protein